MDERRNSLKICVTDDYKDCPDMEKLLPVGA